MHKWNVQSQGGRLGSFGIETKLSKSNWSSCCKFSCYKPWVGSKAWGFVFFTHLHVCSKFLWDEK